MDLEELLATYACGDPWSWEEEFACLAQDHAAQLKTLTALVRVSGIQSPILLGDDGRVWDGHHRLYVAVSLGIQHVPVEFFHPE